MRRAGRRGTPAWFTVKVWWLGAGLGGRHADRALNRRLGGRLAHIEALGDSLAFLVEDPPSPAGFGVEKSGGSSRSGLTSQLTSDPVTGNQARGPIQQDRLIV